MKWAWMLIGVAILISILVLVTGRQHLVRNQVAGVDVMWSDSRVVLAIYRNVHYYCGTRLQTLLGIHPMATIRYDLELVDLASGKSEVFGFPWSGSFVYGEGDSLLVVRDDKWGGWNGSGIEVAQGPEPDRVILTRQSVNAFSGWSWRRRIFPHATGLEASQLQVVTAAGSFDLRVENMDGDIPRRLKISKGAAAPILVLHEFDEAKNVRRERLLELIDWSHPAVSTDLKNCDL